MNPEIRFKDKDGNEYPEWKEEKLAALENNHDVVLKRGNVIPKQDGKYPVYSSSVSDDGLFCYSNDYMFDHELVTWSIDGGGQPFYRPKHKYSVTNVCGYAEILNSAKLIYSFLAKDMLKEWKNHQFDYLSKAHPSVLKDLYDIDLPSLPEQYDIGVLFILIDEKIKKEGQETAALQNAKAAMLDGMFPKEGESVPRIRFDGFTDAWEQRKLGDIVERVTRKNENLESTMPLTISAQYGLIDQNEFFDKRIASKDVSGYYLIRNGEFAYNKSTSADAPWGAIKRLDRYESGVLSTLYIVFRILNSASVDSDYLVSYYETDLWHKEIRDIAAEGARNHGLLNIAPDDFFQTTLMMPKEVEEQRLIGSYFKQLDELITLHQRECQKWKDIRTALLQYMF